MVWQSTYVKRWFLLAAALLIIVTTVTSAKIHATRANGQVDLLLVISLDVSASVDANDYHLMRQGLANAIASPEVALAISQGQHHAIAIAVVQWSGFIEKKVKVPWTRISNINDLTRLSGQIANMTRSYHTGATDIGGGINFAANLILSAPFTAQRKIIDVAGDGTNNVNRSPHFDRDETLKKGIGINGLAILGQTNDPNVQLDKYFAKVVIGGKGAFVEAARSYKDFERAMHRKLIREIGMPYLF